MVRRCRRIVAAGKRTLCYTVMRPVKTLDELLGILRVHLPELRQRYGLRRLGVFGSYVRGEEAGTSDLDLLVEFDERPLSLLEFVALENYLSDLLGIKVDLVEERVLKPAIGKRIREEVVVAGDCGNARQGESTTTSGST